MRVTGKIKQRKTHLVLNGSLHLRVPGLLQDHAREEVLDERHEERFILIDQFGQIHVPEDPHNDGRFTVRHVHPLC